MSDSEKPNTPMLELDNDILKKCLEKYGEQNQLRQAMGECGELIAACQNYYRAQTYGHREETLTTVMQEAVDVYFMVQQIRYIDPELFDKFCEVKSYKVIKKIENE